MSDPTKQLLTGHTKWTLHTDVAYNSLGPDYIADLTKTVLDDLLEQSFQRVIALDWSTVRTRHVGNADGMIFVVEVDVLQ